MERLRPPPPPHRPHARHLPGAEGGRGRPARRGRTSCSRPRPSSSSSRTTSRGSATPRGSTRRSSPPSTSCSSWRSRSCSRTASSPPPRAWINRAGIALWLLLCAYTLRTTLAFKAEQRAILRSLNASRDPMPLAALPPAFVREHHRFGDAAPRRRPSARVSDASDGEDDGDSAPDEWTEERVYGVGRGGRGSAAGCKALPSICTYITLVLCCTTPRYPAHIFRPARTPPSHRKPPRAHKPTSPQAHKPPSRPPLLYGLLVAAARCVPGLRARHWSM